eukprot:gene4131-20945_t
MHRIRINASLTMRAAHRAIKYRHMANWATKSPGSLFIVSKKTGFLPSKPPLRHLPEEFGDVDRLVNAMSFEQPDGNPGKLDIRYLGDFNFGDQIRALRLHDVTLVENGQLVAALFRDYSMLAAAYLLEPAHVKMLVSDTYGIGRESLPANIAVPLSHLSQKLDVYPSLDAAHGYLLNNWYVEGNDPTARPTMQNTRAIRMFLGNRDEEGFIALHAVMASHSKEMVHAQQDSIAAAVGNDQGMA